ncbi:Putative TPR repeat family protein [Giardia duodenalis]|uniref:Outer dynein arm-docking complex subunit 4 n=1 Tax=Giardia intestinalis TaxID=5741 RepID=V6TAY2_GIAIN|nr:Putative TPR repeat family protein [Giardia intestinalis]
MGDGQDTNNARHSPNINCTFMIAKDPLQHPQMGTFVSEAQRCCALHDYPKAIAACKHALELDADNVNVRLLRARCNMLAGHIPESIEDTRCVLQAEPFNHRAHFCLSEALFQAAEFEQSRVSLYRCIELRPDIKSYLYGIKRSEEALRDSCRFNTHDMNLLLDLLERGIIIDASTITGHTDPMDLSTPQFRLWQIPSVRETPSVEDDSPALSVSSSNPEPATLKTRYTPVSKSFISSDIAFFESLSDVNCVRDLVSSGLEFATQRDAFWAAKNPRSISAPKAASMRTVSQPLSPLSRSGSARLQNSIPHDLRDIMKAVEAQRPGIAIQRCNVLLKRRSTLNPRISLIAQLIQHCALLSLGNTTSVEELRNLLKLSVRYPDIYVKVAYHLARALLTSAPAESISLAQSIRTVPAAQRNPVLIGYTCALETKAMCILSHPNTQRSARTARTALQNVIQKRADVISNFHATFELFNPSSPQELLAEINSIIKEGTL